MNNLVVLAENFETIFSPFDANGLTDFIFALLALAVLNVFVDYFVKRKFVFYTLLGSSLLFLLADILKLSAFKYVMLGVVILFFNSWFICQLS